MIVSKGTFTCSNPRSNPPTAILWVADNPTRGPRFVAAQWDFEDDPLQREVFSDVARACIRTPVVYDVCVYVCTCITYVREEDCLRDERMWRCGNGLKHDGAGFHRYRCVLLLLCLLLFVMPARLDFAKKPRESEASSGRILNEIILLPRKRTYQSII